nr:MAG TPA: hypothetical protein [Caudoviricetes sp.]
MHLVLLFYLNIYKSFGSFRVKIILFLSISIFSISLFSIKHHQFLKNIYP